MLILVGVITVIASTIGGFMLAGGKPAVLLHLSEFVVILGVAAGVLIIASPKHILIEIVHKTKEAISGKTAGKPECFDLLKLLYELFMTGRRNGLIALDEHVMNPESSAVFQRYPTLLIKPDQLEYLMEAEFQAKAEEADHPVHLLQLVGDSLPGIGIVAAVLGIINTMSAIADGPEVVGERVAAALTGTLLGIFFAYGFINPLANRIQLNNNSDSQCLRCIKIAVSGFAKGLAPLTAVEIARRSLDSAVQPNARELEAATKTMVAAK
jgi:chemotaxis protein MotA